MDLAAATEVFAHGYAAARSLPYPYVAEPARGMWLLHDQPARKAGRSAELIGILPAPDDVWSAAAGVDGKWAVSVIEPEHAEQPRAKPTAPPAYPDAGLRRRGIEPLFVARPEATTRSAGHDPAGVRVLRVRTADLAERARQANCGRRQLDADDLDADDALRRLYVALAGDTPLGWVTSVRGGPGAAFVSDLFVVRAARRRGIGGALMRALLHDDARLGVRHSVLTATNTGALLYPRLGYRQIATLHLFGPQPDADRPGTSTAPG